MRKLFISIILFFVFTAFSSAQLYSKFFSDEACRVDFQLCGNSVTTSAYIDIIKQEPFWGGRRNQLSVDMNLGQNRFQVRDSATNQLIYCDGFSTLYYEWQTTAEAKTLNKCFENSIQMPFPKKAVKINIDKRIGFDKWETLIQFGVSPSDKLIQRIQPPKVAVREIIKTQSPENAVDIVVIAEGYTALEQDKFFADAAKLKDQLLTHEPFTKYKNRINVYAVAAISEESGISMPHENNWLNTAVGAHYYTFYEPRYMTSPDIYKIRNFAAAVPYDAIYVLANTPNYGGGGIYNFYAFASADSKRAQTEVVVHEFGHSFAGLGDEYFRESPDALDEMYNVKEEPWEPNISSLVHFNKKWEKDLPAGTIIPTPVNETTKKIELGVFEGGGYMTKGIYRPAYDCRMRTNEAQKFCIVCEKSVEKVILHLTEK